MKFYNKRIVTVIDGFYDMVDKKSGGSPTRKFGDSKGRYVTGFDIFLVIVGVTIKLSLAALWFGAFFVMFTSSPPLWAWAIFVMILLESN